MITIIETSQSIPNAIPSKAIRSFLALMLAMSFGFVTARAQVDAVRHTEIAIRGEDFYINGQPTYTGRSWNGCRIEGLLLNARLVQGIFDDSNPQTVSRWNYPDTHKWDPDRNTNEFISAMPEWRKRVCRSQSRDGSSDVAILKLGLLCKLSLAQF
jgi:hypothetical protein